MPNARFEDRVKETTTTTGTGNITLAGAVSQFISFNTAIGVGPSFYYLIAGQTGTEWEVGEGVLSGTTTLVRDAGTSALRSSNSNAAVNFSAGTKDVMLVASGRLFALVSTLGEQVAAIAGLAMP